MSSTPATAEPETSATTTTGHACAHHAQEAGGGTHVCACKGLMKYRRAHVLLGVWLGAFLACHLAVSASGVRPELYQHNVGAIHQIPGILALSAVLILLPMAVQAVLGLFLLNREGLNFNKKCNRGGPLRFFTQKMSGVAILLFVLLHVGTMHPFGLHLLAGGSSSGWLARFQAGGLFQPAQAYASTVAGMTTLAGATAGGANRLLLGLQLLCIWAAAFHVANGLWSGRMIFLTTKEQSRAIWNLGCAAVGVVLAALGTVAWWAFAVAGRI